MQSWQLESMTIKSLDAILLYVDKRCKKVFTAELQISSSLHIVFWT